MTTPPDPNRPAQIILRLPMAKKSAYVKAAHVNGLSLGVWMQQVCDKASHRPKLLAAPVVEKPEWSGGL